MNCTMICITAILIVAMICGTVMFKAYLQSRNLMTLIDVVRCEDSDTLGCLKEIATACAKLGFSIGNIGKGGEDEHNSERD